MRWPASPPISLAEELVATEAEERASAVREAPLEALDATPGVAAHTLAFEGLWMAEVVLGDAPADAQLPLVLMLHGRGDQPRIPGGPFGRVPTAMRVVMPRGPLPLGSGYAWARYSVTEGRFDEIAEDLTAEAARLARLIAHLQERFDCAGTAIVTGFSQGAMLAWTLAVQHPEAVGLVIPIAGWVPPRARPEPLSEVAPARALHGTDDPIVPLGATREWVQALRDAGNRVDWLEYPGVAHLVTPEMNIQFELWLEEALSERAPTLAGGLGLVGEDPGPMEPYEEPVDGPMEGGPATEEPPE